MYTMKIPVSYAEDFCAFLTELEIDYRIKDEHTVLCLSNIDTHWTLLFGSETGRNKAKQTLAILKFCAGLAQYTKLLRALRRHHGLFYRHKQVYSWSIECTTSGKSTSGSGTFADACAMARAFNTHEVTIWLQPEDAKVAHLDQHSNIHMLDLCHVYSLTEAICSNIQFTIKGTQTGEPHDAT